MALVLVIYTLSAFKFENDCSPAFVISLIVLVVFFVTIIGGLALCLEKIRPEDTILFRGSGYGYASICNYNSMTYKKLLNEWSGLGYPWWIKEAREIDWIWRNKWGERVFSPPLGKFPECHLEPNNDYDTGLYEELPMRCIHLGMPGLNHESRQTEKFI